jgi:hypothetical protein
MFSVACTRNSWMPIVLIKSSAETAMKTYRINLKELTNMFTEMLYALWWQNDTGLSRTMRVLAETPMQ